MITLTKPVVGGSQDSWGTTLNTALDDIADALNGVDAITPNFTSWQIGGTAVTATAAELNILDGVTATTAELNLLDGVTATTAELNYVDGVTSNIQTQLDAKQSVDATLTALAGLSTGANKVPYSTGTDAFGQLDFKDEDDMASDSATALPSQQSVKAYVDSTAIGVGQSWQDVSGSRSYNTSYQNSTGRPIMVSVHSANSSSIIDIQVSADNVSWVTVGRTGLSGSYQNGPQFIVPNGHYYRANGAGSVDVWSELR